MSFLIKDSNLSNDPVAFIEGADGIHVGCGRHVLDGWVNLDVEADPRAPTPPQVIGPAYPLEWAPSGKAARVMAIHLIEHFYLWEVPAVLAEWKRVLRPGGSLILELPDLVKCARNVLKGAADQMGMWGLYGDPGPRNTLMCHRWGWSPNTLTAELLKAGFASVKEGVPEWHRKGRDDRDMRLVAKV